MGKRRKAKVNNIDDARIETYEKCALLNLGKYDTCIQDHLKNTRRPSLLLFSSHIF